jgi:hypothetical protein
MIAAAGYTYINEIEYLPLILIIADNGIKEFQVTDDVYDLEYVGNKLYVISSKGINKFDFDTGNEEILYESEIIAWGEENNIFAVADKENIVSVDKQGKITVYNYADCGASELKTLDINGDEIFFGNEKSIYRLFKGSIEEILNYDEDIIRDIECYRNNLYIITPLYNFLKNKITHKALSNV